MHDNNTRDGNDDIGNDDNMVYPEVNAREREIVYDKSNNKRYRRNMPLVAFKPVKNPFEKSDGVHAHYLRKSETAEYVSETKGIVYINNAFCFGATLRGGRP